MVKSFSELTEIGKKIKERFLPFTERGDIPPIVLVEKDDKLIAMIIAPQVDKYLGLSAVRFANLYFQPDSVTMYVDAHMSQLDGLKNASKEEAMEEMTRRFPPGSMQKMCDEEGACATGIIVDCIICHVIDKAGNVKMSSTPYDYHGAEGPPFKWLPNKNIDDPNIVVTGFIPDSLRTIMATSFENDVSVKYARDMLGIFGSKSVEEQNQFIMKMLISSMKVGGFTLLNEEGLNALIDI